MRPRKRTVISLMLLSTTLGTLSSGVASAMDQSAYRDALRIADEYVKKQKAVQADAGALTTSMVKQLYGRYYEVGETWEVAAVHIDSSQMRRTGDPAQLRDREDRVGLFRYEVKKVTGGAKPEVLVHVTQLARDGLRPIDDKISTVVIKVDDQLRENDKTYVTAGPAAMVMAGNTGALKSRATPLELYPLDVPDVVTADHATAASLPELPASLRALAARAGWHPDLGRSTWFDQSDFFGRPLQFLWQQGDPWPTYLKTPNGVAILIRKGGN